MTILTATFRPLVKPATAASHRTLAPMTRRMVNLEATDDLRALPGVFAAALRG